MGDCDRQNAFDVKAEQWEQYTRSPLGQLRQNLVLYQLLTHLSPSPKQRVLDAGSGTGGYALALAQKNHFVTLVDFSQAMLDIARQSFRDISPQALEQTRFLCLPVEEMPQRLANECFDVILCHTLLEYVSHPGRIVGMLPELLNHGGILSLLVANPQAEALHLALVKGDLRRAHTALTLQQGQADLFGLPRHFISLDEVHRLLGEAGLERVAEYGVRIFADYIAKDDLISQQKAIWDLELGASQVEPYNRIARYTHLLYRKV